MTTSTSPSSHPYHHVSPSSDLARAREIFLANGFVQFDTPQSVLQSECPGDLMSRVTCTVWGEYMQTVCRAMVRTHTPTRARWMRRKYCTRAIANGSPPYRLYSKHRKDPNGRSRLSMEFWRWRSPVVLLLSLPLFPKKKKKKKRCLNQSASVYLCRRRVLRSVSSPMTSSKPWRGDTQGSTRGANRDVTRAGVSTDAPFRRAASHPSTVPDTHPLDAFFLAGI